MIKTNTSAFNFIVCKDNQSSLFIFGSKPLEILCALSMCVRAQAQTLICLRARKIMFISERSFRRVDSISHDWNSTILSFAAFVCECMVVCYVWHIYTGHIYVVCHSGHSGRFVCVCVIFLSDFQRLMS